MFDVSSTLNVFLVGVKQGKAYLFDLLGALRQEEHTNSIARKKKEPVTKLFLELIENKNLENNELKSSQTSN